MVRNTAFKLKVFFLLCASVPLWLVPASEAADLPVAPPPRLIRPDGSRDPVPVAAKENPIEVVERIVKNSKDVGDKLAKTDTGTETRGTQTAILKDIDSLIDQQDNPPPMGGDSNDKDKDKEKNKDMNKGDMPKDGKDMSKGDMPKDGKDMSKGDMPKDGKNGMGPKSGEQPKDGNQQAGGRKPRQGGGPPKGGQQPMPMNGGAKQDPGMAQANPMPMPMGTPGPGGPAGGDPMAKVPTKPSLPIDDAVVKEVWGHLPDKLRQQVSQYYKEQFMPKYSDLLKQYYSSLANAPMKP